MKTEAFAEIRPDLLNLARRMLGKPLVPTFRTALFFIAAGVALNYGTTTNARDLARTGSPVASPAHVQQPGTESILHFSAKPTVEELFRARVFDEPLVPVGGEPEAAENIALAAALEGYAKRSGPDDFSSLTQFLEQHPKSCWRAAVLTGLGVEYYRTAHYSLCLEAWREAWALAPTAQDAKGQALCGRAGAELAAMYARLGRVTELETFFDSAKNWAFSGSATEKITGAREGLWTMKHRPEIAYRCGPLALERIQQAVGGRSAVSASLYQAYSTTQGCSLAQVAGFSRQAGLNYQAAFRQSEGAALVVPAVVHWKVGHYAALVRQVGDRYLLQDPTFRGNVWATRQALEAETSGYFLVPPGPLPEGWRRVDPKEADTIWGKGNVNTLDNQPQTPRDPKKPKDPCKNGKKGMMVPSAHLSMVNLNLEDNPLGYTPPVGPPVSFTVRYNYRDSFQPANFSYFDLSTKWTCDWLSYITDNPQSPLADVTCYVGGGGQRTFTDFNTNTQSFDYEQYDETLLTRTATNPISYQLLSKDGSKLIFSQSDGSVGTSRNIFLTQIVDPQGNALTLTYDTNLLLVAVTDAIGQVTTLTYGLAGYPYVLTQVTDPFGRSASLQYQVVIVGYFTCGDLSCPIYGLELASVTDVIGMTSSVNYLGGTYAPASGDFVTSLVTPYGTNTFTETDTNNESIVSRVLVTVYPDGSRDRVEYNESVTEPSDPPSTVPQGMNTYNNLLVFRNTFYWSRNACGVGYGDYTKARLYHWLHSDQDYGSGILESTKEPLENRVWFDYAGQNTNGGSITVGINNLPTHEGRVLDDGSTQLYTYGYNAFGNRTNSIDPLGRTFSYIYASNGVDLIEMRQTRAGNNDLLARMTYNSQHLPLTRTDAAGQTTTCTYNSRGQLLTITDPRNELTTYTYDTNGYLLTIVGPLPGTNETITFSYDSFGRVRTRTDQSGYALTIGYDALDRIIKITHPDGTYEQYTYYRLDPVMVQDRAGRQTLLEYDAMRQLTQQTDPLNRVTLFQWCRCGQLGSLTDPLGRTTTWQRDDQDRLVSKVYPDGSQIRYVYENTTSRMHQVVDERSQLTQYRYNADDTVNAINYANASSPTPNVSFTYDPNYKRRTSMTDGNGTTFYTYYLVTSPPALGANQLAIETVPLPGGTITYAYDELGRRVSTAINGAVSTVMYDAANRTVGASNVLGTFTYGYDGASDRLVSQSFPNQLTDTRSYGSATQDLLLRSITYQIGASPVSEFLYTNDVPTGRIMSWSQQAAAQPPAVYSFGYDAVDQLLSAAVTNAGLSAGTFAYTYDPAANRLSEQVGPTNNTANYNSLNQLSTISGAAGTRTNEWDAESRLVAVTAGPQRTEFSYDGLGRLTAIRQLVDGSQVSLRQFVWCDGEISEERDASGAVTRRFFEQGEQWATGTNAGNYYYTLDHLGSIRELTDGSGNIRARYSYDPFGRRTKVNGDLEADFGFAGMFWTCEAGLFLTQFRAYDPGLGRWLSRDPIENAEKEQGPNLYAYVRNNPVNDVDPLGLCCEKEREEAEELRRILVMHCILEQQIETMTHNGKITGDAIEQCIYKVEESVVLHDLETCVENALNGDCKPKPAPTGNPPPKPPKRNPKRTPTPDPCKNKKAPDNDNRPDI